MGFNITVKLSGNKNVDLQALAQQLANLVESMTKKRTIINVRRPSGGAIKR